MDGILTARDQNYPHDLRKPLYYRGDINLCGKSPVAVIGSRTATREELKAAYMLGKFVSEIGRPVLNGLAIGCDTAAIEGALSVAGKVIAVLPCGIDDVYPAQNKELAQRIIAAGGLMISEYPPGTSVSKEKFIARDRIQAILSDNIIIVTASVKSGTMHTAEYAGKYATPIGCISMSNQHIAEGNQYLVQTNKATLLELDRERLQAFLSIGKPKQMRFA